MAQVNKVSSVRTLALVARDLAADEDWLAELANGMDPEDGLIWVYGIDDEDGVMAFTDIGVENLATLISDYGSTRPRDPDDPDRAAFAGWIHRRAPRHRCNAWSYLQSYASLLSKSEILSGHFRGEGAARSPAQAG